MGEGESSSVGGRFQPLWKMLATGLAVPSPVGRERVSVRVVLFDIRLLSGTCFCTSPKWSRAQQTSSNLRPGPGKHQMLNGNYCARCSARRRTERPVLRSINRDDGDDHEQFNQGEAV